MTTYEIQQTCTHCGYQGTVNLQSGEQIEGICPVCGQRTLTMQMTGRVTISDSPVMSAGISEPLTIRECAEPVAFSPGDVVRLKGDDNWGDDNWQATLGHIVPAKDDQPEHAWCYWYDGNGGVQGVFVPLVALERVPPAPPAPVPPIVLPPAEALMVCEHAAACTVEECRHRTPHTTMNICDRTCRVKAGVPGSVCQPVPSALTAAEEVPRGPYVGNHIVVPVNALDKLFYQLAAKDTEIEKLQNAFFRVEGEGKRKDAELEHLRTLLSGKRMECEELKALHANQGMTITALKAGYERQRLALKLNHPVRIPKNLEEVAGILKEKDAEIARLKALIDLLPFPDRTEVVISLRRLEDGGYDGQVARVGWPGAIGMRHATVDGLLRELAPRADYEFERGV